MSARNPNWSVVATVDEPPALVQAFVAWHLHLGAQTIHLYCDNPDDPLPQTLAHLQQVVVVRCDAAYWQADGKSRPKRHQVRQVRNARHAYAACPSDWLVHIDADEFLWPGSRVAETLASVAEETDGLIVPVEERLHRPDDPGHSVFEGAFRRPFRGPQHRGRAIFGSDYDLTQCGLTGHAQGKAFARCGRDLSMSVHRHKRRDGSAPHLARPEPDELALLHFDGLTPLSWVFKRARMLRALEKNDGMPPSEHRKAQTKALVDNPGKAEAVYQALKSATPEVEHLLRRHGLWHAPAFEVSTALARYFPDEKPDLSPDAMDQWLFSKKANVIAYLSKSDMKKGPPDGSP
ncbi:glycosyltransferase family 2 protein [Yoonia litorea]|uniref:Glycosyl transferase family 2 n=1 Tax=Yoonia litorea TaxID=1123755 RepID=A0A1I6L6T5_9RHOB|nr:glycosyltransferase family 2 protein [Yoonia litorea]SFR98948.1 Glycosyl transferase family 2 [Yoonia litorea]